METISTKEKIMDVAGICPDKENENFIQERFFEPLTGDKHNGINASNASG